MTDNKVLATGPAHAEISEDQLKAVEKLIEEEEGATNRVGGWIGIGITAIAVTISLYHLYAAYDIVPAYVFRPSHVACVLFLTFLLFPMLPRFRDRIRWWDCILALASVGTIAYMLWQGEGYGDRAISPEYWDYVVGVAFIVLLLEATRRSTGWIMPVVALVFILYALFGHILPAPWTHRGYSPDRLVGHLTMTLEGIFGTTVDVASSLIILFTIFGAILQFSGAGKFFIDFSFALMGGKRNAAGRAVVLSSFLMGGPSGSGVATTVTIGTVAYPMLAKAGYDKDSAGGLLAAGGLGAIISPPVLGAAAFLIAEFLKISYFDVILMACIPTLLYYFAIAIMVELDAKKYGGSSEMMIEKGTVWRLTKTYWFHFGSLISIIAFMLLGYSPVLSVFWATVLALAVSAIRAETALVPWPIAWVLTLAIALLIGEGFGFKMPYASEIGLALVFGPLAVLSALAMTNVWTAESGQRLVKAFREGTTGVLNVATTCATAGIIVGVVTLTGLAQRFADIIIGYAQGSLLLTTIFTAMIVWIVGLAVPVTASYIMCAVIAAPALIKLGVPDFAAHMFIFYYAVLSEVSPPTALSPFAAAAITGGSPYKTTLQSWKYTMPAFLVPFVFVLDKEGVGLLLKLPKGGTWLDVFDIFLTTAAGIAILCFALQGRFFKKSNPVESAGFLIAGLLLVFPSLIAALVRPLTGLDIEAFVPGLSDIGLRLGYNVFLGLILAVVVATMQRMRPQAE
jgi:TRAP transporter 4TM/12TM fusion protein